MNLLGVNSLFVNLIQENSIVTAIFYESFGVNSLFVSMIWENSIVK